MKEPDDMSADPLDALLEAVEQGEPGAMDRLVEAIYPQLKRIAHFQLDGERAGHTLNTTAIVHEAFVRLVGREDGWNDSAHLLRAAAMVMRHILVDYARQRNAAKRGHGIAALTLYEDQHESPDDDLAILDLDSAIRDIGTIDADLEQLIECRYFAGLSVSESARVFGVSERTIERRWLKARAYLRTALEPESG